MAVQLLLSKASIVLYLAASVLMEEQLSIKVAGQLPEQSLQVSVAPLEGHVVHSNLQQQHNSMSASKYCMRGEEKKDVHSIARTTGTVCTATCRRHKHDLARLLIPSSYSMHGTQRLMRAAYFANVTRSMCGSSHQVLCTATATPSTTTCIHHSQEAVRYIATIVKPQESSHNLPLT
jgi:hypothetical protein